MKTTITEITSICYYTRTTASELSEIVTKLDKYGMKICLPFRALSLRYALPGLIFLNCILTPDCIHMYRASKYLPILVTGFLSLYHRHCISVRRSSVKMSAIFIRF